LLLVSHRDDVTPAALRKHYELIRKKWPGLVVVVKERIRSNDRHRLIVDYKLPFVVPGNQLYLPDFGLDLREHFRRIQNEGKPFSPSTQVLVLHALLTKSYDTLVSTQLVTTLSYTPMTIKRALDEIEQAQIGVARMHGRKRELKFEATGRELWNAALPFLRSPVKKQVTTTFPIDMGGLEAGLTALSRHSMISAPVHPTWAVSEKAAASMDLRKIGYPDGDDTFYIQIWRYEPTVLSTASTVDRLSLFLSLRDTNDERVEAALDEMMESVQW